MKKLNAAIVTVKLSGDSFDILNEGAKRNRCKWRRSASMTRGRANCATGRNLNFRCPDGSKAQSDNQMAGSPLLRTGIINGF